MSAMIWAESEMLRGTKVQQCACSVPSLALYEILHYKVLNSGHAAQPFFTNWQSLSCSKHRTILHGTIKISASFKLAYHWSVSWARWIQSTPHNFYVELKVCTVHIMNACRGGGGGTDPSINFSSRWRCQVNLPSLQLLYLQGEKTLIATG
jgi:hypothetical protein